MDLEPIVYYYRLGENSPPVIQQVLEAKGWREYPIDSNPHALHPVDHWNLSWRSCRFKQSEIQECQSWQRINHFPKSQAITHKDTLLRHLRKAKSAFGRIYDFFPLTYILPSEFVKFASDYSHQQEKHVWICKPADLSRGRKIFLIQDIHDLSYDCPSVVQKYIERPLLIGGYKFDLRIYVLVKSFHPLTVYMYKEGLARFATEKYGFESFHEERWKYAHLTNSSVNKLGPGYQSHKEGIGMGSKWPFARLRDHFRLSGIEDTRVWNRIKSIITLTLLTIVRTVPPAPGCFELFGFDVILDERLKPWLLEVNFSPAMVIDCEIDAVVKEALVSDMVDLLDIPCYSPPPLESERRRSLRPGSASSTSSVTMPTSSSSARINRPTQPQLSFLPLPSTFSSSNNERLGNFEKIFPFNEVTFQLAKRLGLPNEKEVQNKLFMQVLAE
eukprot:TRINITY_DN6200_c0_g1_i2.p1 TRINITY_DN6200_c0_g1~~TRINITY_DN6200_c0_g1_i2.p1  ORF type:complete len:443 (+),score=79.67 TRINITY_DN6200_c0_g1_i2:60-1388(+)